MEGVPPSLMDDDVNQLDLQAQEDNFNMSELPSSFNQSSMLCNDQAGQKTRVDNDVINDSIQKTMMEGAPPSSVDDDVSLTSNEHDDFLPVCPQITIPIGGLDGPMGVLLDENARLLARIFVSDPGPDSLLQSQKKGLNTQQGQGRKRIEMTRLKSGWTLLMTSLILEIASAVFDQLGYALVGMVLAFVALLLAAADLIHMAQKERMSLLPIFHRPSTTTLALVDTIVKYFGLVGAVWLCFYSAVEYAYARQKKDNPIKMCLLPFIFLLCVVISKLIKKSYIDKSA